jgi:uncharacterized protein involved in exopolysaccharide biosynthesis
MDLLQEKAFERRSDAWSELLPALNRHKFAIFITFFMTVMAAYGTLEFVLSERYDSVAKLLVKLGRENSQAPPTVMNSALFTSGIRQQELYSEVQMLTSRSIVERTVDSIGPDAFKFEPPPPETLFQTVKYYVKKTARVVKNQYKEVLYATNIKKRLTDRENAIIAVESSLNVEVEKDSDVVSLRVGLPSGPLSVRVAETLLDFYFDDHIRVLRSDEAKSFFEEQVESHRALLSSKEQERDEIRQEWNLSNVAEQRRLALERLSRIESMIADDEVENAMLREQTAVMQERVAEMPERLSSSQVINANPSVVSIKDRIAQLQIERAKLANQYREDSQVIRNIDEEIAAIEALRKKESDSLLGAETIELNPLKQKFVSNIEETRARIAGLEAVSKKKAAIRQRIEEELLALNLGEDELNVVERERLLAEQNFINYAKRSEEARIAEQLDARRVANVAILTPPSTPIEPAYPPKLLVMAVALAVGLLMGIGMALLLEYVRETIETPTDIETVGGVAFLGTFHLDPKKSRISRGADRGVAV